MLIEYTNDTVFIFYITEHIGDTFHTQKVVQNIIESNKDKNIYFYMHNNLFIHSKFSEKLISHEINIELCKMINKISQHPYQIVTPINKEIVLVDINKGKLTNCSINTIEMNPESYQKGIIKYFEKLSENNLINFKYVPLENKDLLPVIPATNIDLFLQWKKTIPNPLIFYYNYFPKSGQLIPCMTDYEHEQVIIHIAKINPNYIILVPKYTEGIKDISNIVSCEEIFNCKENKSCENLYKINKILCQCEYSVHYDIGASMTYMNTDVFLKKNTILHFKACDGGSYYEILTNFLKSINPTVDKIHSITCRNYKEMLTYFDTPLL